MYKVLIVDDEENVREAIKILGDWQTLGVDTIIEAEDGRTGIRLLCNEKPDIVILDMRMPEMNGVEFLQAAEKSFPSAINIVISGYDDFEFTRQAIKSKVFDYLLKPINRDQLNNTLSKAIESIIDRREKQEEMIDRNINMNETLHTLKEKIYMSAIDCNFDNQINAAYLKMIGIDGNIKFYGAALLRIMNINDLCRNNFKGEREILFFALLNVIEETFDTNFKHFCFKNPSSEREIIFILISDRSNSNDIEHVTCETLTKVTRKLHELFKIVSCFGTGGFNTDISMLSESYKMAAASLNNVNLFNLQNSSFLNTGKLVSSKNFSILSKMTLIRSAFESGSFDYTAGILDDFLNKVEEMKYLSLRESNKMVNELIFMLNDITMELDTGNSGLAHDSGSELQLNGISFDYVDFSEFRQLLMNIAGYYYDRIRNSLRFSQKFNTKDVKEYIDKNYFQEIKISMFTEKYYLSKVYIMKLFKHDYGMSIYEYVQKVRMEKSKELLEKPKINIKDISEMVGYSNNNYFSKAFKNYYHISPSEFRMLVLKQNQS